MHRNVIAFTEIPDTYFYKIIWKGKAYTVDLPFAVLALQDALYQSNSLPRPNLLPTDSVTFNIDPRIGSFNIDTNQVFLVTHRLPQVQKDSKFLAYCEDKSPNSFYFISYDDTNIAAMPDLEQMYVIVHDWLDTPKSSQSTELLKVLLAYKPNGPSTCVIKVDWRNAAHHNLAATKYGGLDPIYNQAAANGVLVGRELALLLKRIIRYGIVAPANVHIIGIGLGCQVAHTAGERFQKINDDGEVDGSETSTKIGRITGLDPTGTVFDRTSYDGTTFTSKIGDFLNQFDATFVDVIHTTENTALYYTEEFIFGTAGTVQKHGHIDFYPNGGTNLKNKFCTNSASRPIFYCHQNLAIKYFTESVQFARNVPKLKQFRSCRAKSYDDLGRCNSKYKNKLSCFGTMGMLAKENGNRGVHYLKYPPSTIFGRRKRSFNLTSIEIFDMLKIDGFSHNLTHRQALNVEIPFKPDELYSDFPTTRDQANTKTVTIHRDDHPSCGRFRKLPPIQNRVHDGYRPYRYQFPWSVCMQSVDVVYQSQYLGKGVRQPTIPRFLGFYADAQHDDRNDKYRRLQENEGSEDFVYITNKNFSWRSTYLNSHCTGSVIHRNWIITAAHCFK